VAGVSGGGARRLGIETEPAAARRALAEAAAHLAAGGLVAFPTETVYGLGADATDAHACARVYAVKGRPADNPLIVHFADRAAVEAAVGDLGALGRRLADALWPGPLTLVVPRPSGRFAPAAAGLDTIAVRVPSHPMAHALLEAAALPVAAPSANRSGRPSATSADDVWRDLAEASAAGVDVSDVLVLDGGWSSLGLESTVVDVTGERARILRLGSLEVERIEALVGPAAVDGQSPRSPGSRHRHYAPRCPLWLFDAALSDEALVAWMATRPGNAAVLARAGRLARLDRALAAASSGARTRSLGPVDDVDGAATAHGLFAALRWCDDVGAAYALAEFPRESGGRWPAVRDRLLRAAEGRFVPSG
jgi:L-threonylcarbamoyladenylate synthase